jgi:hypothetical protein
VFLSDPLLGAEARAPFLDHDPTLLLHLGRVERDRMCPVLEDLERRVDDGRLVRRYTQHVHGLIEGRVRVEMRAKPHADPLDEVHELLLLEAARPVERHVLDEVREPALVIPLEHRAGVHGQPQLGALLGARVLTDVVAHAVRQPADHELRVDRKSARGVGERRRNRGGSAPRLGGSEARSAEPARERRDSGERAERPRLGDRCQLCHSLKIAVG